MENIREDFINARKRYDEAMENFEKEKNNLIKEQRRFLKYLNSNGFKDTYIGKKSNYLPQSVYAWKTRNVMNDYAFLKVIEMIDEEIV